MSSPFRLVAALILGIGLISLARLLPRLPGEHAEDSARRLPELGLVIRTPQNLRPEQDATEFVGRLSDRNVVNVVVQFKQDESDEFQGGVAFYPSAIAPVAPGYETDPLTRFLAAAQRRGIEVAAWLPAFHDPAAAAAHPEWRAIGFGDDDALTPSPDWLCPREPAAVRYQAALLSEVAARYSDLDAIYTDFLRFDGDHSCVCSRCLAEVTRRLARPVTATEIRLAARERGGSPVWRAFVDARSDAIAAAASEFASEVAATREDLWFGAFVLPFSAAGYESDTQSGQDFDRLADSGIDELIPLGYWDDFARSPDWLRRSLDEARRTLDERVELAVVLDGDCSELRMWRTLDALTDEPSVEDDSAGRQAREATLWFHYGEWTAGRLDAVSRAAHHARRQRVPEPDWRPVAIRIDTEPDYRGSYEAVNPAMIERLVETFARLEITATFVTCGRLAEKMPQAIVRAAAAGHEIALHAYDHEQLDSLGGDEQRLAVDRGLAALRAIGIEPRGFGAPRNSITDDARDHLIDLGFRWDGSASLDPLTNGVDPWWYGEPGRGLLTLAFVWPNDYDARYTLGLDAEGMLMRWRAAFQAHERTGEPPFVLDVHQWLVTQDDNLAALEQFITETRSRPGVRFVTLSEAAEFAARRLALAQSLDAEPHAEGRP